MSKDNRSLKVMKANRKVWAISPVEKVVPNKRKKDLKPFKYSIDTNYLDDY